MGHIRAGIESPDPLQGNQASDRLAERLLTLLAAAGLRGQLLASSLRLPSGELAVDLLLLRAPAEPSTLAPMLQRLRAAHRLPCLVLAPRLPGSLVAELLDAGADDVLDLAEPAEVALARSRAVLRRGGWGTGHGQTTAWRLVPTRRALLRPCGTDAELTSAEFDLFRLLTIAPGETVCRDTVAHHVLRRRIEPTDRSVDNLVMRLRRKLGEDSAVKTVRGQGYMFAGFESGALLVG